jgi:hypothetical protein
VLLLQIQNVRGANHAQNLDILIEVFMIFFSSVRKSHVPEIMAKPISSASFPIHYLLIILYFDDIHVNLS